MIYLPYEKIMAVQPAKTFSINLKIKKQRLTSVISNKNPVLAGLNK